ncbi:MAG: helix-turn-helix transcriptional regulator [Clostridia bacterium]|nr:helix-turn-helix transcriptional regulator [Clostridia bacterium]
MNVNLFSPYVRSAKSGEIRSAPDGTVSLDYIIAICDGDEFSLLYDGQYYLIARHDRVFLRPGVVCGFDEGISGRIIHFDIAYENDSPDGYVCYKKPSEINESDRSFMRRDVFDSSEHEGPLVRISNKREFSRTVNRVIETFSTMPRLYELSLKSDMLKLLSMIVSENFQDFMKKNSGRPDFDVGRVKRYIDENTDTDISLGLLEDSFGFSRFHILREFEAEYGITPIKYLSRRRMLRAASLLEEHSVQETAAAMGYSYVPSFSNAFKGTFGMTPDEWKSRNEGKDNAEKNE